MWIVNPMQNAFHGNWKRLSLQFDCKLIIRQNGIGIRQNGNECCSLIALAQKTTEKMKKMPITYDCLQITEIGQHHFIGIPFHVHLVWSTTENVRKISICACHIHNDVITFIVVKKYHGNSLFSPVSKVPRFQVPSTILFFNISKKIRFSIENTHQTKKKKHNETLIKQWTILTYNRKHWHDLSKCLPKKHCHFNGAAFG